MSITDSFTRPASMLLEIPDVMADLSISRTRAFHLIASGELPSIKLGRVRRVRRSDLEAFVANLQVSTLSTDEH